jgi:hypothetical protein
MDDFMNLIYYYEADIGSAGCYWTNFNMLD